MNPVFSHEEIASLYPVMLTQSSVACRTHKIQELQYQLHPQCLASPPQPVET